MGQGLVHVHVNLHDEDMERSTFLGGGISSSWRGCFGTPLSTSLAIKVVVLYKFGKIRCFMCILMHFLLVLSFVWFGVVSFVGFLFTK